MFKKVTKTKKIDLAGMTSQFLDEERKDKAPVPAPRGKKASQSEKPSDKKGPAKTHEKVLESLEGKPRDDSQERQIISKLDPRFSDDHETEVSSIHHMTKTVVIKTLRTEFSEEPENDDERLKHLESLVASTLGSTEEYQAEPENDDDANQKKQDVTETFEFGPDGQRTTRTTTTTIITKKILLDSNQLGSAPDSENQEPESKTPDQAETDPDTQTLTTKTTKIITKILKPGQAEVVSTSDEPENKTSDQTETDPDSQTSTTKTTKIITKILKPGQAEVVSTSEEPKNKEKIAQEIEGEPDVHETSTTTVTRTIITKNIFEPTEIEIVPTELEPEDSHTTRTTTTTTIITTKVLESGQVQDTENEKPEQIEIIRTSTSRESSPPDSTKSSELVKVKQFTVAENIIEVIPLRDAIKQGKIEPKICRIMENGNELPLTVHDALVARELSPTDVVQIISSHVVVLLRDTPPTAYLLNFNDNFNEQNLREIGLYDKAVPCFVDPWTGNQISFQHFVFNLDVLDPSIFVKDQKLETYLPIQQAFDESLIDPQLGTVVDTKTSQKVPIFDAVNRKFIIQRTPQDSRTIKRPSTIDDLMRNGNINFETDEFIINNQNLSLVEALRQGALDTNTISVRDPASGDILGYKYAADRGIVDIRRGVIINTLTLEEILIIIAYRRGYLLIGKVQPISLNAAMNSSLYDKKTNKIKNPANDQLLSIEESILQGLIDPKLTDVKDTKNNSFIVLKQAIEFNLVDPKANMIKNKKSSVPLDKAMKDKLIFNKTEAFDLAEIITRNYYDPQTGKMLNPYTNKYITIKEAINLKIINIHYIRIYDVVQDRVFTVEEAIANGLLDDQKGVITRPRMTLDKAFLQRILISFNGPLSLPSALNCNLFDKETRKFNFDDQNLNLGEAIESNKIAGNELVLYDPSRQRLSTLNDAISAGFLDPVESVIVDPISNKEVPIDDAMEQGLLVKSRSDVSLRDAVFDGLYDPNTGSFSNVTSSEKLQLESAINRNVIDVTTTVVSVNNVTLDFEQAIEQGLIDPQNAMIKTKSGDNLNLIEAFDQGILNTITKPVRLHEAVIKHLYDESCGLFTDPETRKKITILESLHEGLIEPNSIQIQDPGSKSYLPISINFAIQTGLINGKDGHVNYNNKIYSLKDAFDLGILIDSKGPCSIQRTIHQGSFNDKLGRIADPFSDKNITVHEAMRKFVVNPHLPCYFDEESERLLTLNETCKLKLIDRFQGDFTVPYSGEKLTLPEAMKRGWIIDIESGNFTLYKILLLRLVNLKTGKIVHPVTSRQMTLNQAIEQELVDPATSLVKNRNGKFFDLNEALRFGVIDGDKNLYWASDSLSIPLLEAMDKGLVVSNEKPFSFMELVRMRLYRPDTGKFVDPLTNSYYDLKSGIDAGLVDEDSTQFKNLLTKQIKPLSQAISDGDINVAKGRVFDQKSGSTYNYDVAFDKGLLIHLPRGLAQESKEPVQEIITSVKVDLIDSSKPREMTLDDVIKAGILNPETALIKDPKTGKFILLRLFIETYQINLTQKAFVDPKSSFFTFGPHCVIYNREPQSFDDVIESKQMNLVTGKLVDPQNGDKDCTIQEAIESGLLDPDTILIKDGAKNKLLRVNEALRKGLIDPERSTVVDTVSSKLYNLENAIQEGLLMTPKRRFDLLEALQFNLYDPTTGNFADPFAPASEDPKVKANVTFEEALARGLIDTSTTMVRTSSDSEIIPISAAITSGVIDAVDGKLKITNPESKQTESIDFVKAKELSLLVPAGERVR